MGTLRTIFAIAVVLTYSSPFGLPLLDGRNAVQLFYVISGFLISYVLTERKTYTTVGAFYLSRYLRLYPVYFVVAIAALALNLLTDPSFPELYRQIPGNAQALLIIGNSVLFGQDWVMFAAVKAGHLVPSINFEDSDVPLYEGLLVPQAWTLGVALSFYLIAPFILPRRRWIWGLLFASVLLRAYLMPAGFAAHDPWAYGFFPTALALFLCGSLAHQILLPVYRRELGDRANAAAIAATIFLVAVSFTYPSLPGGSELRSLALTACFVLLVPLTFMFQNRYWLDQKIGELSYPIYVCHMLVVSATAPFIEVRHKSDAILRTAITVALTVALAAVLNACIAVPFEQVRLRLKSWGARPARSPIRLATEAHDSA